MHLKEHILMAIKKKRLLTYITIELIVLIVLVYLFAPQSFCDVEREVDSHLLCFTN